MKHRKITARIQGLIANVAAHKAQCHDPLCSVPSAMQRILVRAGYHLTPEQRKAFC